MGSVDFCILPAVPSIDAVIKHYHQFDVEYGIGSFSTDKGYFTTSSLNYLEFGLSHLKMKGYLGSNDIFLDAGSGDGRVTALASAFDLRSYGIDCHDGLVDIANEQLVELAQKNVFSGHQPRCVSGDFLAPYEKVSSNPYTQLGISFDQVDVFYNFINSHFPLANLILEHAKPGALFLFYSGQFQQQVMRGLFFEEMIIFPRQLDLSNCDTTMQVFRKH